MATTAGSGRSPTAPLFFPYESLDNSAYIPRLLDLGRSSLSCSNANSVPKPSIETAQLSGTGPATITSEELSVSEDNTKYEVSGSEFEYESAGELRESSLVVEDRHKKSESGTSSSCTRSRESNQEHEKGRSQQRQIQDPASPTTTTASSIKPPQRPHHRVPRNPNSPPPLPPPVPPTPVPPPLPPPPDGFHFPKHHHHHPHHHHPPTMSPPSQAATFASCGHSPPPRPADRDIDYTPTLITGYCRPCHFTRTRTSILRTTMHFEEQIADTEARIAKAEETLLYVSNEYLTQRKNDAVRWVVRLKERMEEECRGVWAEFDERWGGKVVLAGSS